LPLSSGLFPEDKGKRLPGIFCKEKSQRALTRQPRDNMPKALTILFIHKNHLPHCITDFIKVVVVFNVGFKIRLFLVVNTEQVEYINYLFHATSHVISSC